MTRRTQLRQFTTGCCLLLSFCLWDLETLLMEKVRFPGAAELIAGEFRRHSPEFHQWRIQDRLKKLEVSPEQLELLDDLAVSYEKTGQTPLAIQTMLDKAKLNPNQYETHANLGTFYIHAGEFENGLAEIEKAILINPDAHFGREVYQKFLVEYLLSKKSNDEKIRLPLSQEDYSRFEPTGFAKFVVVRKFPDAFVETESEEGELQYDYDRTVEFQAEIPKAIKGVLGMMRFGNFDSPILLEALGDLLMFQKDSARHLATRAYLKASIEAKEEETKKSYREKASASIHSQTTQNSGSIQLSLEAVEEELNQEIEQANKWFQEIKSNESKWIESGADVEAEYAKVYFEEPSYQKMAAHNKAMRLKQLLNLSGCLLAGLAIFFWWKLRSNQRTDLKDKLAT